MSNGSNAAFTLGLGVAGGAAIWYFTRDKKKRSDGRPVTESAAAAQPPVAQSINAAPTSANDSGPTVGAPPPRVAGPCSLKLDKAGLTADGERVDIPTAVERCKAAGRVEWALFPDAPSAVVVELSTALAAAKLPVTMKK